ncbi:D-alanyl-D-alanine carboxypeptidase family protein [Paenibacillus macerans]|uniref:M15 family metallopeptidase n=1 Tax=Paenibacillus macerans TaxID=44252 RepID=UPI00203E355D|nr:M15 family metallopeptidase [Paenibacillus macerans]MCM3700930.1 M15 family metallopeptidase [Paenibacillus macerans]
MYSKKGTLTAAITLMVAAALFAGCGDKEAGAPQDSSPGTENAAEANGGAAAGGNDAAGAETGDNGAANPDNNANSPADSGAADVGAGNGPANSGTDTDSGQSVDTAAASDPYSSAVLINKQFALPDDYEPKDLVYPDVRFTFKEKIEKRMMRKEAAEALEELFSGAEKDGIYLAGVSAYRSHSTQTALFNRYVKKDGEEKAKTYSAVPGHSEHETGLAIDVSGSDGKCAAESCFGDTKEAAWLADHVVEYGFIIRYPEGKEDITGYKYEPWHLRYVGKEIAADIAERGITLEEYYDAVPVSGQ